MPATLPKIAIVYYSNHGSTLRLAEHIAIGAEQEGAAAHLYKADDLADAETGPWADLAAADAIVFGTPTYMGSAATPFKAFMDATSPVYSEQAWKDKLAAGFSSTVCPAGDRLNTLTQLSVFAAQHGMLWLSLGLLPGVTRSEHDAATRPNRLGDFLGMGSYTLFDESGPPASDLTTAELFGQRIAAAAKRWKRGGTL